jgi:hypothetical protein
MTRQQVLLAAFVRDGERLAVLFSVGLGAVVGALAETPWPLIAAVLTAAAMTAVYEADIRRVEEAAA